MSIRGSFLKTGFTSTYLSCCGKVLVSIVLLNFTWKNLEKMLELFILIILVGMSLLWVAFEASKASISLQTSSIVTNVKEKQSEESLASLILKTLGRWKKFPIAFTMGWSLISDNMGRSVLRVSTNDPWIF